MQNGFGQFGEALQFAAAADHVVVEDDTAFHKGAITQVSMGTTGQAPKRTRDYLWYPAERCDATR